MVSQGPASTDTAAVPFGGHTQIERSSPPGPGGRSHSQHPLQTNRVHEIPSRLAKPESQASLLCSSPELLQTVSTDAGDQMGQALVPVPGQTPYTTRDQPRHWTSYPCRG